MESIQRKSLLYKTAVEYGDYTINHVEGCSHGCLYPCYAFLMAKRFGKIKTYKEWIQPKIVSNALELLEKEIPKYKNDIKFVQLSFTTDPFMYNHPEISKLSFEIIKKLNNIATSGLKPDLTIYLDINPNKGVKKAKTVNKGKLTGGDRIERESLKFHNNVRKGFLELAKEYPDRIKKIKTNEVIEKTQKEINKEIDKFFKKKKIYV